MRCEVIAAIKLMSVFTSSRRYLFVRVRMLKLYSLSQCQVDNTVLSPVTTTLYIR